MENFTFPPKPRPQGQAPQQQPLPAPRTMRRRSHSRSGSISAQITPPAQLERPVSAPAPAPQPALVQPPRSRPNSSHKRNSSVSNRRESAELMGIPLPPEDPATKDMDPVRRALLALEGKNSSVSPRNSFGNRVAKVQIPDFDAIEKSDFTEPRRPPLALNSSLAGKRDSFGKLLTPASSTKIELGTLLEEEEEEEDENIEPTPVVTPPSKPRPQTLDLRSLSVTTALTTPPNLPTPAATPSPRVAGLKSLTLASSPLILGSPAPLSAASRSATMSPPPARVLPIARKSSVSYKRSDGSETPRSPPPFQLAHKNVLLPSLLTPDPTPTTSSPPATPNMSPSRRSFIYQSHSALVSRVSELERLLAAQSPIVQTPAPATPANDEFLALIADLKAERDELKRDAQLHKTRIADLEKQSSTLMNRVETERREAWVVREQLGVLEIEKAGLEKDNAALNDTVGQLNNQVGQLEAELEQARREREEAQRELASMRERARPALKYVGSHNTGFSFQSIDSLGSATDVDDVASHRSSLATGLALKLKAVVEEEPDVCADLAQYDDSVARYEDDSDDSFYSRSRTNSACSVTLSVDPPTRSPSPSPVSPSPAHGRHASLSHGWSFKAAAAAPRSERRPAEVDKFFVCLDDQEDELSADDRDMNDSTLTRANHGFGFGRGFGAAMDDDEDDLPPFVLPAQPYAAAPQKITVVEEDEDEDEGINFKIPAESKPLQFSVNSSRSITPTAPSPPSTVSAPHAQQAADGPAPSVQAALQRAFPLVEDEDSPPARPKLTLTVTDARTARPWEGGAFASSSRAKAAPKPSSSFVPATTSAMPFTTAPPRASFEFGRRAPRSAASSSSSSSSVQVHPPSSLSPPPPAPTVSPSSSPASLSSPGPWTPVSPFKSRLSSFTSFLGPLMSIVEPLREPAKVSRDAQLERLRAEIRGERQAQTWMWPDTCGKCAQCSSTGTIEL